MSLRLRAVPTLVLALLAVLVPAGGASATELLRTTVVADRAQDRSCTAGLRHGAGQASKSVTSPAGGWVTARLDGDGPGDWDLAIYQTDAGRLVGGSASFGAIEVAQGIVGTGAPLTVQACRRSGDARTATLTLDLDVVKPSTPAKVQLVKVSVPNRSRLRELQKLGLDLSEHGRPGFQEVVLYGPAEARKLREAKFTYTLSSPDLVAADRRARARDRSFAARTGRSSLPSGRDTYRRLPDFGNEMKALVEQNPGLVRPITLPFKTYEGRTVEGIEITSDVNASDGKPVFLNMGVHHAREWPSAEHAMEWAYELVNGYKAGDARTKGLVESTRTIVIPVVNPDGFNISREAGEVEGASDGRGGEDETVNIASHPYEYRRKNCRLADDSEAGSCTQPSVGLAEPGVDPNRNYGGFWGGPGADTNPLTQTYRGPGPFSEPETRNIRDLISKRQVTTFITNHTFSALVLRPPGIQAQGPSPDEDKGYKALGDAMGAENGYLSQLSYQLYDTTGTTEDWSYYATGGFGFTFEIGCPGLNREGGTCDQGNFHPPYADGVVAEYDGTSTLADDLKPDGGGNREAYFQAQESTANPARHSVLEGSAPAGAVLRLKKSFKTLTYPQADGNPIELDDTLESSLTVPGSGSYQWHINPSTRPVVAVDHGRQATGDPSDPIPFNGGAATAAPPCGDANTDDPNCFNDHPFEVPANGSGVDNAKARVRIEWNTPASDWDMKVFRDVNGNEVSDAGDELVGTSAQGPTDAEETQLVEPVLRPGKYVVRVVNFAAVEDYEGTVTFEGPDAFVPARTESWTLTCERPNGEVLSSQEITIGRGQRQSPDLSACAAALGASQAQPTAATTPACASAAGFSSVALRPSGRRVRFDFARRVNQPVSVDVFQVSVGRRVIGERRVARFSNRSLPFTWDGRAGAGKRVRGGYLFARYTMRLPNGQADVRRKVLRYIGGRFSNQPDFYRRESCALLRSYKLERAVFGGRNARPLATSFRLTQDASVSLQVLRGSRVVKTLANRSFAANRTHRARLSSTGLATGDYRVRITVRRAGSPTTTATLTSRRL